MHAHAPTSKTFRASISWQVIEMTALPLLWPRGVRDSARLKHAGEVRRQRPCYCTCHVSRSLSMNDDFQQGFPWRSQVSRRLCHPGLCVRTEWGGHARPPITFVSGSKIGTGISEEAVKDVARLELSDLGLISESARPRAKCSPAPGIVINRWKLENQFNR